MGTIALIDLVEVVRAMDTWRVELLTDTIYRTVVNFKQAFRQLI